VADTESKEVVGQKKHRYSISTSLMDRLKHAESDTRPFGDAVLDGSVLYQSNKVNDSLTPLYRVDLDIESGSPQYYSTFVEQLRTLSKNSDKQYVKSSYANISNLCL